MNKLKEQKVLQFDLDTPENQLDKFKIYTHVDEVGVEYKKFYSHTEKSWYVETRWVEEENGKLLKVCKDHTGFIMYTFNGEYHRELGQAVIFQNSGYFYLFGIQYTEAEWREQIFHMKATDIIAKYTEEQNNKK